MLKTFLISTRTVSSAGDSAVNKTRLLPPWGSLQREETDDKCNKENTECARWKRAQLDSKPGEMAAREWAVFTILSMEVGEPLLRR